MSSVGDSIRPLFPGFDLDDSGSFYVQRAVTVGSPGVREALARTPARDLTLNDDDYLVAMTAPVPLSDPAFEALVDDSFDGAALNARWAVVAGAPTVSGGLLQLPNSPSAKVSLIEMRKFVGRSWESYGWTGEAVQGGGILVQSASYAPNSFQFIRTNGQLYSYVGGAATLGHGLPAGAANRRVRSGADGQTYFEISEDGKNWTALRAVATPAWVATSDCKFSIVAVAGATGTKASVDRVVLA